VILEMCGGSATPEMSSMRRTKSEGERMVGVPPERLRRDAWAAITPSPQPFIESNSPRSNTTDRCRSMTASKIAPSPGALTRSTSLRIASAARAFTKPMETAHSPRRILGRGHFGVTAFGRAAGAGVMATRKATGSGLDIPKRLGKCQHATLRTVRGDGTGLDTKSLPPNGG